MNDRSPVKSKLVKLTTDRHDRDVVGFKYVYPVVSRRAKGVSIGINLNYDNRCNWRCVYCQVEGLSRGPAPTVDLEQLERELLALLDDIEVGDFLERHVPAGSRRLADIAISGNGEPTGSPQFADVIELIAKVRQQRRGLAGLPVVLITNGSLADRAEVKAAIARLSEIGGRVWFKLDAGTDEGLRRTNSSSTHVSRHLARLASVAKLCPTLVQSCWFRRDGQNPSSTEVTAYVEALRDVRERGAPILGVQLYTLARESHQPESAQLGAVTQEWLDDLARRIELLGLAVDVAR